MEFLEIPLFDDDIYKLAVRFVINLCFLTVIVTFAIYPNQREREFAFTAVMMNITVFFICFTMKKLELGLGMALGLFAIFGVLRYRTDAIRAKEMTYLFIVIGMAVINSLSNKKTSYAEIFLVNMTIFTAAIAKEWIVARGQDVIKKLPPAKRAKQRKNTVDYDRLELLGPEHRDSLLTDLRERTGIDIQRVQINNIDFRNACATLTIWYDDFTENGNGDGDLDDGPAAAD